MACIAESGSGRSACRLLTALALALIGACTSGGDGSAASSVPVVTPSSAYSPFRYTSPAQRAAFEAYVACAAAGGRRTGTPARVTRSRWAFPAFRTSAARRCRAPVSARR